MFYTVVHRIDPGHKLGATWCVLATADDSIFSCILRMLFRCGHYVHCRYYLFNAGDLKAESELCLDCRFIAVEGLLRNCHSGNHKASVVVYKHRDTKEIVPVKWPKTVPNGPFKVQHPQHSCREPKCCTFQHHVLQTKILNLWKCSTVPASTEPPPVSLG